TVSINVNANMPPIVNVTAIPMTGPTPLFVSFDASSSTDPEGGILTFSWDFDDGTSGAGATPTHTYTGVGTYVVVVTVTDDFGNSVQGSVTIDATMPNMPPTVSPVANPSSGYTPLDVQFTANASDPNPGDLLTYAWDFGDGTPGSTEADPLHTYTAAGTYIAEVAVSDGEYTAVGSVTICVNSQFLIDVTEAKVDFGKEGKAKGKISFKAEFACVGVLDPTDLIVVEFDGITLLTAPFSYFELGDDDNGHYMYKEKNLHMKINFRKNTIHLWSHKMILTDLPENSNGIDVVVSFGPTTGNDHFVMHTRGHSDHGEDGEKLSYKRPKTDQEFPSGPCMTPCGSVGSNCTGD
ncbi:PKD domain-containing protein, partial [Thermodesulfobacteriota bacterium]